MIDLEDPNQHMTFNLHIEDIRALRKAVIASNKDGKMNRLETKLTKGISAYEIIRIIQGKED